jgi:3-deoxy-manno-octulosonate cytidylyltransferase (CMP-KDO synthetase)
MKTIIIIPARYASTRLPAKPLAQIAEKTMIERTVYAARLAANMLDNVHVYVATDDERISSYCASQQIPYVMTSAECKSGTDRVAEALRVLHSDADLIINLQGDAPLTPPHFIAELIEDYSHAPCDVITPVQQLDWPALDRLREAKRTTPFSGTCAVFHPQTRHAYWFSKNIIPAMRKENSMRNTSPLSPIYQHIGLYGYSPEMLLHYSQMAESAYEQLEGLEQLRFLEEGFTIRCVPVMHEHYVNSGVDSPEDIIRAEAFIREYGDPMISTQTT